MKLDITRGIQRKGIEVPFALEERWGEDSWRGETIAYVSPVSLSGTYMIAEDTVVVNGTVRTAIQSPCARCAELAVTPVEAAFNEAFMRETGEESAPSLEDDVFRYTGHVIALDEAVRSAVLLELPTRVLCREDCRGLCAQCGANLNVKDCSCQKDVPRRNPFSALASLLNEDEEV